MDFYYRSAKERLGIRN